MHLDRAELLRRERRDLDVRAHPDAQQQVVAARAARRLLRAELRHARDPQRLVERALVVPDVVGGARRGRVRERVGRDQVLPADVDGIHPQLGRDQVHRALDERRRLRPARPAIRRHRRRVRDHAPSARRDPRDRVDAGQHLLRRGGQERPDRVRAHVAEDLHAHADDGAVAPGADLHALHLRPAVVEVQHALRPRLGPPHRTAERLRGRRHDRELRIDEQLRPEPAADVRRHDAHPLLVDAEQLGQIAPHVERHLRRAPDRVAAVVLGHHRDRVRLHGHGREPLLHDASAGDDVGALQHVDVPVLLERGRDVRSVGPGTGSARRRRPRPPHPSPPRGRRPRARSAPPHPARAPASPRSPPRPARPRTGPRPGRAPRGGTAHPACRSTPPRSRSDFCGAIRRSSAVKTAATPGIDRAASTPSMPVTRPCGMMERTNTARSASGMTMFSRYRPSPAEEPRVFRTQGGNAEHRGRQGHGTHASQQPHPPREEPDAPQPIDRPPAVRPDVGVHDDRGARGHAGERRRGDRRRRAWSAA